MSDILEIIGVWLTILGIITAGICAFLLLIAGVLLTRAWFWLAVIAIVLLRMHS